MNLELPNGFTARPPTADDAQAVNALIRACDTVDYGKADHSVQDIHADWRRRGFELERDAWLVFAADGALVAYGNAWDYGDLIYINRTTVVHPDYREIGLEEYQIARVHTRARLAPHRRVQWVVLDTYRIWIERLEALGYQMTRHDYVMEIALDEPPPTPVIPDGFVLRAFARGRDERAVWATMQEAFRDQRGYMDIEFEAWASAYLDHADWSPELSVVVTQAEQVVAASMVFNFSNSGWIRTLGVSARWRKHGLGLAILYRLFGECYTQGIKRVGLGVDAESLTGATRLYERAGMRVKHHYVRYELEIKA